MEGGTNLVVGPTNNSNNQRPVRAASTRHFNYGAHHSATLTGPVRRWHKRWVPVSPPPPSSSSSSSSKKPTSTRTQPRALNHRILLCKWTPLSLDAVVGDAPRRKFRYTPIAVVKEQKKVTAKIVADEDFAGTTHSSEERQVTGNADKYGMLDMNTDLAESPPQETSKGRPLSHYSRRN